MELAFAESACGYLDECGDALGAKQRRGDRAPKIPATSRSVRSRGSRRRRNPLSPLLRRRSARRQRGRSASEVARKTNHDSPGSSHSAEAGAHVPRKRSTGMHHKFLDGELHLSVLWAVIAAVGTLADGKSRASERVVEAVEMAKPM